MTQTDNPFVTKKLRVAGALIITGLLVEGLSLGWNHPLSFIAFLGIGAFAMFLGMVIFLAALVSPRN